MPRFSLSGLVSPEGRTALFYITVFALPAASAAYLGIWLTDKGLSAGEIGWINSVPIFLTLIFNISVGRLADRAGDWRTIIVFGALISALMPIGLFFVNEFWGLLAVLVLIVLPFALVTPVIDAAVMRMTRRNGSDFAFVRAFGTVGYMLALAGTAWAVAVFGGEAFLPVLLFITIVRAVLSLALPRFRAAPIETPFEPVPSPAAAAPLPIATKKLGEVMKPWFLMPVIAFALVQSLHYILSAFAGVVWRADGIAEGWVGPLLVLGAFAEVMVMFLFKPLAGRYSARQLMVFAMLASALRWTIMAFGPPLWLLALIQLTHGFTFGFAYLGLINFIANWTGEDVAAEAQSFATMVQLAVVVLVLSGFGYVVDMFGHAAFGAGLAVSLLGAVLLIWSLRAMPSES